MFHKSLVSIAALALLAACGDGPTPATPAPPPAPPPVISYMLFFDWDSDKITPGAASALREAAQVIKSRGITKAVATGYTDSTGSPAYNMGLAQRRANAVKGVLVKEGVSANLVTTAASGEGSPLVPLGEDIKDQRNRRVELILSK